MIRALSHGPDRRCRLQQIYGFSTFLLEGRNVVNGVDYLCSWNFTHLVKVSTRREVNLVNSLMGYGQVEIVAPPEL